MICLVLSCFRGQSRQSYVASDFSAGPVTRGLEPPRYTIVKSA